MADHINGQRVLQFSQGLFLTFFLFLSFALGAAQDPKQNKPGSDQEEVIKITSNLVSLDVMVKDKKGKPVTNLKAEDFTVTENGVRQNIEFFDAPLTEANPAGQPAISVVETGSQPTGHQLPRNIISLVLDGQTTEGANLKHVREGITKYIRERIKDGDSVALFAISGGLQLLQPFTQDKEKLIAAAEKAYGSSSVSKTSEQRDLAESIAKIRDQLAGAPSPGEITTAAGGSAAAQVMIAKRVLEQYLQLRSALSNQQTRPILAALAAICEGMRPIRGKKTLVMFSQGFVAPEALDWQVQSTIDIANRANVAIYIIDSTGLTGGVPKSSAVAPPSALAAISAATNQEDRIRAAAGESIFDTTRQEGLDRQQDLLYRISGDTGGQLIKNTNDIALGLNRVDEEVRSRYTLAYRSTDSNFDGRFRKVKIDVRDPDVNVVTRPGYNAIPSDQVMPFSPAERKLLADFATTAAKPTLPLSMELNSFRSQQGSYIVPLSFEIPPNALQFQRQGEKQRLQLDVLGVVRAEGEERILSRMGGNFDVSLTAAQYESISKDKIFYRQDIQLEPGAYTIDLIVKDRLSGKVAAKREKLLLPAANTEFSATESVLSRHADPFKQPASSTGDVFAEGNVLVRPSPSREFRNSDNLIIFFKLYNAAPATDTGKPIVRVTVMLRKDGKLVTRPVDYELTETVTEPLPHLTFAKFIKLTGLKAGKYTALIESRDMVQNKLVKQEAWFTITD